MSDNIKEVYARISHKSDTEANWLEKTDFVPILGELIIYQAEDIDTELPKNNDNTNARDPITFSRVKIGDGKTPVNDLPFFNTGLTSSGANVLNDKLNQALAPFSTAGGTECRAGIYGYRLLDILQITNDANELVSAEITIEDNGEAFANMNTNDELGKYFKVDDNLIIDCQGHFYNGLAITGFKEAEDGNTIIIISVAAGISASQLNKALEPTYPEHKEDETEEEYAERVKDYESDLKMWNAGIENWVWVFEKPAETEHKKPVLASMGSYASGVGSTAVGYTAVAIGRESKAIGNYAYALGRENIALYAAHAEGRETTASGQNSHTEGAYTIASGVSAHAEGASTKATGNRSHAEGNSTEASGDQAHAEGSKTIASGHYSHAEGASTVAEGRYAHAEGSLSVASGEIAHAEGRKTTASGNYAHAEGNESTASGAASHVEGYGTIASSAYQHVQGKYNIEDAANKYAHIVGGGSKSTRKNLHTLDWKGNAWFAGDITVGNDAVTLAKISDKLPNPSALTINGTTYDGSSAVSVETVGKKVAGAGELFNNAKTASGEYSHAEGYQTEATGKRCHAEGNKTIASGDYSHAEGASTKAIGTYSHTEGASTEASGQMSHAEGRRTKANADHSHTEGNGTIASGIAQHVQGKFNIEDNENKYAHIVGNGSERTYDENGKEIKDENGNSIANRKNIHTVEWNGDAWFAGEVTVGINNEVLAKKSEIPIVYDWAKASTKPSYTASDIGLGNVTNEKQYSAQNPPPYPITSVNGQTGQVSLNAENVNAVPTSRKINNKVLSDDIALTADDIGARPNTWIPTASDIEAVPTSRKINDKPLFNDIILKASDIEDIVGKKNSNTGTGEIFNDYVNNTASGIYSHAEGCMTEASGDYAHAEGYGTRALGNHSCAEGYMTTASGKYAHSEGNQTTAEGDYSHSEGNQTNAIGDYSHAEGGAYTTASGSCSHAEGRDTKAIGYNSHTEGRLTEAHGASSHAEGWKTIAKGHYQHVQGRFNIVDENNKYAHIIGNGNQVKDEAGNVIGETRSNAHTIDWNGNGWFAGNIYVGGTGYNDKNAKRIPITYSGTTEPDAGIGTDGDIYIMYE